VPSLRQDQVSGEVYHFGSRFRRNGVGSRRIEMVPALRSLRLVLLTIGTDSSGDKADDSDQSQVVYGVA